MTDEPVAPTPEERGRDPSRARSHFDRHLAKVRPGSYAFEVLKRTSIGVYTDGFIYAGNLAYLALMTVFPFFIVAAAVLSLLGQSEETQRAVVSFLRLLPPNVGDILRKPIADVLSARQGSLLWLGALVGLWTVGSFVETIREIFRRAYGTTASAAIWRARLGLSLAIVGSVILALISFLVQGLLTAAEQFIYRLLPFAQDAAGWLGIARIVPGLVMFGALFLLFYSVTPSKYRYTSSRKWPGALFTTLWWISMTAGLPLVLSSLGGYDLTYGSLAGVVVMLLFFYLIGLGLVFGAHLNAALADPPEAALEDDDATAEAVTA
ncbi:YihY/virulence factor BrkB family protein [Sphingomonas oligophenolica]|uniref:YihY/virulence factor BrkB family protein n=1 Tax=Sphingomonas oligophenolica TaxID=301154 RepID=A0A502CBM0_9SPHN|nr:YihY/virulence factor BrkB family protein [Sphingomonas oligophenolica]TPG10004.1 YihY/virulence factor BrkB family protein [Sphingomonas oligophenolica]